ncbi:MAG: hypothetical protein KAS73_04330 [Candidatus Sabulitectum sp.]|nr:hypothetical protein [Candidatus Sabulitectum sp.]
MNANMESDKFIVNLKAQHPTKHNTNFEIVEIKKPDHIDRAFNVDLLFHLSELQILFFIATGG